MRLIGIIGLILIVFSACSKTDEPDLINEEIEEVSDKYIHFDLSNTYQTVDGFGSGIKRRTEDLYKLNTSLRQKIEKYCFQDLEVNMIRFFIYHDLEPENDNNNPLVLDRSKLDWTRYESDPSNWRSRYVGEALNNALTLSTHGFDHIIGNCNSGPGWLKTNGLHTNGGTLISGMEAEYSEFLIAFLEGMKLKYNIDVTAISPTNEPDYQVTYESMNTSPEELSNIVLNLKSRLNNTAFSNVQIISPECFRVQSNNTSNSTTNYINTMFANDEVAASVDVVASHTYADKEHNADWQQLKKAAIIKPIWITESANLKSKDQSMTDAAHYIKWMINGFNEGGMTAYMTHLFYEEAKTEGYSSLVAWTSSGEIILPKRYFGFKHFSNLIKPGFKRIKSSIMNTNLEATAFVSPDGSKVVLQVFNEGAQKTISLHVPPETQSVKHFITSNNEEENFKILNNTTISSNKDFITIDIPSLSMNSFVYNLAIQ
jgi:O-glycosyl hydrolase